MICKSHRFGAILVVLLSLAVSSNAWQPRQRYKATLDRQPALKVFDKVWSAFDREYAMFAVKPKVNWRKLRDMHRPRAEKAKDNRALAHVLAQMLRRLEDLHVYVQVDGDYLPGYTRQRPLNASARALQHLIGPLDESGTDIDFAQTKDGIGYISVDGLGDKKLAERFEIVLRRMKATRGLILDLRFNGGGGELLARKIAGCFLDRERVYAMSQYRSGRKHTDLTRKFQRSIKPNERLYYKGPVVVLQGQKTMSSAEAFALMLDRCPNVTTMGDRTAGSSGNPRRIDAGAGIIVNLPRWIPLDADGRSIDAVGVQPDVMIKTTSEDFTRTKDPVLSAALKHLRELEKPKGAVLTTRSGEELPDDAGGDGRSKKLSDEIRELWAHVVEVNRVWLDPKPSRLSYKLVGSAAEGEPVSEMTNRVWIVGDDARWELKAKLHLGEDLFEQDVTLVISGGKERYLRASHESLLAKTRPARNLRALRQGVTWSTAMHVLAERGLPDNCRIVERTKDKIVLEMNLKNARSRVGLGLYHLSFGAEGASLSKVRLHIRLPDHTPIVEELIREGDSQHNITVRYDDQFHVIHEGRAPKQIFHQSLIPLGDGHTKSWKLAATFQVFEGNWLLEKAANIQGGKTVRTLQVTDVSTKPIPMGLFEMPTDAK